MSKPAPPPAPDYKAAAEAQGVANVDAARTGSKLSNPNIINPYGSQTITYGVNGDPDQVLVKQELSPVGQELFDQQNRISQGLGDLAEGGIDRVGNMLGSQFDMSQVPDRAVAGNQGWQRAYDAIINRNQSLQDRSRNALAASLANKGIVEGSEAYRNAMDDAARAENDFALAAQQQAMSQQTQQFGLDTQARQNAIQEQAYLRSLPLNEINALRSGAQVNMPQFQAFSGQNVAAAPLFQATQAQGQYDQNIFNQKMAGANAMTSGLFSLGSAAIMASDIRLKENVRQIGYTNGGLPLYQYNYIWSDKPEIGVMAQEVEQVLPEAVIEHSSGYKMVDYSKVQ